MASESGGLTDEVAGRRPLGGPGYDIVEAADKALRRYRMLTGGEKVLVAVSGGPDSVCLLDVLRRLADRWELSFEVAHVDHGLSESSGAIAAGVATAAAAAGLDAHVVRVSGLEGPNLHARARELRYGFFDKVMEMTGAVAVATAHTLDDRVETTLARLIRGATPGVLAGIPPSSGGRIRPLIWVRRAETRTYCEELGLDFFDDPANEDERFDRAAIRTALVRAIEERWGEGAIRAIGISAERAAEEAAALDAIAQGLAGSLRTRGDLIVIDRDVIEAAPRALQRRLLESAVGRIRDREPALDEALDWLERAQQGAAAHFDLPGGAAIDIDAAEVKVRSGADQ